MSRYNYPNWHEIKDLTKIYEEEEWDSARIVTWDPIRQKKFDLYFTGSTKPGVECEEGTINFIIMPTNPTKWDNFKMMFMLKRVTFMYKLSRIVRKFKEFLYKLG